METIDAIRNAVNRSPLKYIKGQCRLSHLIPGEWLAWYKGHPFDADDPVLIFAVDDSYLGKYVVKRETVEHCRVSVNDDLSMSFVLREGKDEANPLHFFIEVRSAFPDLLEVGQFVVHSFYEHE
ncbi:MAG: hypothetical protein ACLFNO_03785 [Parcubacteria group bacterium]